MACMFRAMPVETLLPESPDSVEITASRLGVWRGEVPSMPRAHRHDDLELNFVLDGALEYLFGGSRVRVESGQMALFWAATPHRLIAKDATPSDIFWLHIPLAKVLSWGLPNRNLNELLINQLIVVPAAAVERNLESMFKSWTSDLESCEGETIALLEAHAVTRRALQHHLQSSSGADENQTLPAATGDCMMRVTTMAQFMTAHFRQNISMSDIASSAHLSPNYAMTLFRDVVGTTLGNYLTRCRVAEAQRLLITTSMTTVAIAHAAGFGSQSSFYDHFTRLCGSSPGTYRRSRLIP